MVKLDVDTLPTVPDAPPAAGPDRALDPAPPDPGPPATPLLAVAEGDVAVAEGDVVQPAESPITALVSAAATTHPLLLFDSDRRTLDGRACFTGVTQSGEEAGGRGGAAPAPPGLPATDGPDVTLETGRSGRVSRGLVGS
jgi:hypothetical protein